MKFLNWDGDEINIGLILRVDFSPQYAADMNSPEAQKAFEGPIDWNKIPHLQNQRARIFVCGRPDPLETFDPQRIARVQKLWDDREIINI